MYVARTCRVQYCARRGAAAVTIARPHLDDAACHGLADLFLKDRPAARELKLMREICASCWERPVCLAYALQREEYGFWAGRTAAQLRELRDEHGIKLDPILVGQWI